MNRAILRYRRTRPVIEPLQRESVDRHMVPAMRLTLAISALVIIYIDPAEPDRYVAETYASLVCYAAYSAALYVLAEHPGRPATFVRKWSHWIDVAWYALLVALSSGTSSIFFFGFLFAILAASFRWGFESGLCVTVASAVLFTAIGLATADPQTLELNRFLLRPAYLLVLGYMMASWGGFEIELNNRLDLLRDVSGFSNPRLGVDHAVESILERLCAYFGADACLLVRHEAGASAYRLHEVTCREDGYASRAQFLTDDAQKLLLALPGNLAVAYNGQVGGGWRRQKPYAALDVASAEATAEGRTACETLTSTLEADTLLSVPMRYADKPVGRLYVATRGRAFDASDVTFLLQVIEQVTPLIESIRLVDRLASTAAEQERQRMARDIHDSVIQPYIGLQMGLSAIRLKLSNGDGDVAWDVDHLSKMAEVGIETLRGYVRGVRDGNGSGADLLPAVRRFSAAFAEASGIEVRVEANPDVRVGDRLAVEVFQMIAEGLSNVRRHTRAGQAVIRLAREGGTVAVEVENDGRPRQPPVSFTPRSIAERAAALGGGVDVGWRDDGATVVRVEIPM